MVEIPAPIKESIQRFLKTVNQRYRIRSAYLYGSQTRGTATTWSDIDLAVISDDFSDDLFEERLTLMRLAARIDDRIEPRPYIMETFNRNDPVASDILRHGVRVE